MKQDNAERAVVACMTGEPLKPALVKIAEKAYAVAENALQRPLWMLQRAANAQRRVDGGQSHKGVPLRGLMALNQAFFSLF